MRPLLLYARSRHVPGSVLVATAGVAVAWCLGVLVEGRSAVPALLAVVVGVVAVSPGLAGDDMDLDRTAAVAWPPRRAAHLVLAGAVVAALVVATALTGRHLGEAAQVARDVLGLSGLLGLGAVALGAGRAWIAPLVWALLSLTLLPRLAPPSTAGVRGQVLTWVVQPVESSPSVVTAGVVGMAGILAYAMVGARPIRRGH
jgi:hypothetical protein